MRQFEDQDATIGLALMGRIHAKGWKRCKSAKVAFGGLKKKLP
jgi:hypothetical protein